MIFFTQLVRIRLAGLIVPFISALLAQQALALGEAGFVDSDPGPGSFPLCEHSPASIVTDKNDWPGVLRAANDLVTDIHRVTGQQPQIVHQPSSAGSNAVIIGTIGKSKLIDQLIREKKLDAPEITRKWESFFLQVVPHPLPGIENALVICGSDKRGTIYGIYELSEQIGVSPWHWWADVPPKHHDRLYIKPGKFVQGPPSVKYRGIFLNDEYPALTRWVENKYGHAPNHPKTANYGPGFYTNLFELMLRIRANYLWPAMWNNAFNEDDRKNPRLADEYGIVMGTSHQEPMLRAQKEWDRSSYRKKYGNWDYTKPEQRPALEQFWREGIHRNKKFESIITMGLRAENDSADELGKDLTEQIVKIQRSILAEELNPDLSQVPQAWCLYKEVMGYYRDGLRVPDDVTLLWAEDNWGNLRRLPTPEERLRSGGAGIYYHFDYHGGPRSYQWINTSPLPKIWDQMTLAKQYGADRIWIVNVGHFKGYEFPMEFFMRLAWNTDHWTAENLSEYTRLWAAREFGPEHAREIAQLLSTLAKYNGRRKPELLDADSYSLLHYREFETVAADYQALASRAEQINAQLPPETRDAFYELVLFPAKACAQLNALYLAAAKNTLYAYQGRASVNDYAAQVRALFVAQTNLMDHFNRVFAGGKWNHFMDQPHLGYTNWSDPKRNTLNAVPLTEIQMPETPAMGVQTEGSISTTGETLEFDRFGQSSRYVDVFNKGKTAFDFRASASEPWICLSNTGGRIEKETRIEVRVDWGKTFAGSNTGQITFSGAGANYTVNIRAFNPSEPTLETLRGFVEADGCVSMEAEHYTRKTDAGANRWIKIPDYGHTLSGMRATGPADALATPGKNSPSLEYRMYLFTTNRVTVEAILGSTLNFIPGRPLRFALAFDDATPNPITIIPADFDAHNGNEDWEESVKNNCRRVLSSHDIGQPGYHTLKIWMVDPGVVLQKIVVDCGGTEPSYLGPPESLRQ